MSNTPSSDEIRAHRATARLLLWSAALLLALGLAAQARAGRGPGDSKRGASLFGQQRQLCHATSAETAGGQGPSLAGVVGRRAGAAPHGYSRGMSRVDLVWTAETLDRFLAAPSSLVPGTSMSLSVAAAVD